jgi:hypothetical protein
MAGPSRTITPLPSRGPSQRATSLTELRTQSTSSEDMRRDGLLQKAFQGKLNCAGTLTLETSPATTTDIDDPLIVSTTVAFLQPIDSGASAEDAAGPPTQTVQSPGKIRLTHTSSAGTRTYAFLLIG